jgi:hypothetical protein
MHTRLPAIGYARRKRKIHLLPSFFFMFSSRQRLEPSLTRLKCGTASLTGNWADRSGVTFETKAHYGKD